MISISTFANLIPCSIEQVYYLIHNGVLDSTDDYHISADSVYEYMKNENIL